MFQILEPEVVLRGTFLITNDCKLHECQEVFRHFDTNPNCRQRHCGVPENPSGNLFFYSILLFFFQKLQL